MSTTTRSRVSGSRSLFTTVTLVLVSAVVLGVAVFFVITATFSEASSGAPGTAQAAPVGAAQVDPGADQGREAGELAGGTLALSESDHPAISGLQADLRDAIGRAAADADAAGVEMWLTSGWRSPAYQQRLLDSAIDKYGSEAEALRRVASPQKSAHVRGAAVDIGPTNADDWLNRHGARYGLCQAYANEMWHFELLVEPGGTCPAPLADASELEG